MIALTDKKILVFTPNKCASTTVNQTLIEKFKGQLILAPQGPYKQYGLTYHDCIGSHSTVVPEFARYWHKIMIVRDPYDRFVSLWKHYCRYHKHNLTFEVFIGMFQKFRNEEQPAKWFYTWRMRDYIESVERDVSLIDTTELDKLAKIVGLDEFPHLHSTEHDQYKCYYTPELYRRVYDLA